MLDDDGRPEDYAEQIASILKAEPRADYMRVHTELKRLYRVVATHKRLRTYLDTLDRSTIASDAAMSSDSIARRRSPKDTMEQGSDWLLRNEDRVHGLLKTLGVCGYKNCGKQYWSTVELLLGATVWKLFLSGHMGRAVDYIL